MKDSYNLGLGHMCDLLFVNFPCGTKQRYLYATEPRWEKPQARPLLWTAALLSSMARRNTGSVGKRCPTCDASH